MTHIALHHLCKKDNIVNKYSNNISLEKHDYYSEKSRKANNNIVTLPY